MLRGARTIPHHFHPYNRPQENGNSRFPQFPHLSHLNREEDWELICSHTVIDPLLSLNPFLSRENIQELQEQHSLGRIQIWASPTRIAYITDLDPQEQLATRHQARQRLMRRNNHNQRAQPHNQAQPRYHYTESSRNGRLRNHPFNHAWRQRENGASYRRQAAQEATVSNPNLELHTLQNTPLKRETLSISPLSISLRDCQSSIVVVTPIKEVLAIRIFLSGVELLNVDSRDHAFTIRPRFSRELSFPDNVYDGNSNRLARAHSPPKPLMKNPYHDSMKIILWNVRGAGHPGFKSHFLHLVQEHKPGIAILVETKLHGERARQICSQLPFDNFTVVDAVGFKGGLWILWNKAEMSVQPISSLSQVIHATVQIPALAAPAC